MNKSQTDQDGKSWIYFVLIIFAAIFLILLLPKKYPSGSATGFDLRGVPGGCISFVGQNSRQLVANASQRNIKGDVKDDEDIVNHPPTTDLDYVDGSRQNRYQLVLANVPISMKIDKNAVYLDEKGLDGKGVDLDKSDVRILDDGNMYMVGYPNRHTPVDTKFNKAERFVLSNHGLIFLVHLNPDRSPVVVTSAELPGYKNSGYVMADVYQEVGMLASRPIPQWAIDECQGKNNTAYSGQQVEAQADPQQEYLIPDQSTSEQASELQLEWFMIHRTPPQATGARGAWSLHCKPAVYLYPPQKMLVNVKVKPNGGYLTYTDPLYDSVKGWNVEAYPDGKLETRDKIQESKIYDYLYFESKVPDEVFKKPERGWVVKKEELNSLYQEVLPKLGLNKVQVRDFTEYWNRSLPESAYYFVGVIDPGSVDNIERLEITPKPDSINRVRIYFERLDEYKQVEEPTLDEIQDSRYKIQEGLVNPESEIMNPGFKVVEWGGMIKNDPNHPFTCSQ